MNFEEDDLLPISALSHLIFCKRRAALIHIEQIWIENRFTAEGRIMHERVHGENRESRGKVHIACGLLLKSFRLGLTGKADVVEFHKKMEEGNKATVRWLPFPVEYKRGKPKKDNSDKVQLCAQALCLEEMLRVEISCGALFYGKVRRRQDVSFDDMLRAETENVAKELHMLFESGITPKPVYTKKCDSCSLVDICLPKTIEGKQSINRYLLKIMQET